MRSKIMVLCKCLEINTMIVAKPFFRGRKLYRNVQKSLLVLIWCFYVRNNKFLSHLDLLQLTCFRLIFGLNIVCINKSLIESLSAELKTLRDKQQYYIELSHNYSAERMTAICDLIVLGRPRLLMNRGPDRSGTHCPLTVGRNLKENL